jgi:uncharacterized protein YjbI with pentapeptide repeats
MRDIRLSEIRRLVEGKHVDEVPVVSKVRFPPKAKWPFSRLVGIRFEGVDFNSPILGGLLSRPVIVDCEFSEVILDGVNCTKARFEGTEFRSSVFGRDFFGSVSKTEFRACKFEDCGIQSMEFSDCTFSGCEFSGSRIGAVNFRQCNFADVVIDCVLTGVNFLGCSMQSVDLSNSKLFDSNVLDSSNQDVLLPDRPDNFLATYDDFEKAKPMLRSELSADCFDEYCAITDFAKQAPFGEMVDEGLFEDFSTTERSTVMRVLFEIRRSTGCANQLPGCQDLGP